MLKKAYWLLRQYIPEEYRLYIVVFGAVIGVVVAIGHLLGWWNVFQSSSGKNEKSRAWFDHKWEIWLCLVICLVVLACACSNFITQVFRGVR